MILIGMGANLDGPYGPPEKALRACLQIFDDAMISVTQASSIWKSAPVPVSDQPWYKNAVCAVETDLPAPQLLAILKDIEADFGRVSAERNAARVLDLDILSYHHEVLDGNLVIPHPRLQERAFVLYPLREIVPTWVHPVLGKSVEDMITELPQGQDCVRIEGIGLL